MFTSFTLTEIARQRQSVLMARSNRDRQIRRSSKITPETCCAVIEMPRPQARASGSEALVA